ncbi:MAG: hypothetical protein R3C05_22925 [Pirellulaceae bacterium]
MLSLFTSSVCVVQRTMIAALLTIILAAPVANAVAPQAPQESGKVSKEPVAVFTIASLDGFLRDVNHLSTISGMPQAGAMLNLYVGAYSQGVDKSQPLGVVVRMIDGVPAPMLFVAIADVKGVLKNLEPQFGAAEELDDGTMVMQAGQNLVYIRDQGDWAFLANDRSALADLPNDPKSMLQGLHKEHDIGIRANLQQIPEAMRMGLIQQMRQAFDDAVKRMAERNGGQVQPQPTNEAAIKQLELLMRDSEYLTLGITIDAEKNELAIDMASTAIEGSKLAQMYNDRKPIPSKFADFIRPDATFYMHAAATTGKQEQETSLESIDQSLKQLRDLIGQSVEVSESDAEKIEQYLPRVKDLLKANVRSGKINGGLIGLTENNQLRVLLGGSVTDGRKIEQLVKDIYGEFDGNPDAPQFTFDAEVYKGMTLHRGTLAIPSKAAELRKMFGEQLSIVIATSDDRLLVGAGEDSEALLKQFVDSKAVAPNDLPLSQGSISLLPALQYAYWVNENSVTDTLLKTLQRNPENDEVRFVQPVEPNGQRIRLTIDDGVLQVIGAAAQAGRQRPEF